LQIPSGLFEKHLSPSLQLNLYKKRINAKENENSKLKLDLCQLLKTKCSFRSC